MRMSFLILGTVVAFVALVSMAAQPSSPVPTIPPESDFRAVTQRIEVKTVEGTPVATVPLSVWHPFVPNRALYPWSDYTDPQGILERTARIDINDRTMSVWVTRSVDPAAPRASAVLDQKAHIDDLQRRYAFLHSYTVPISGNEQAVDFPIRVRPAVTITGSVSMPGRPRGVMHGAIVTVGYNPEQIVDLQPKTGKFTLKGVPKGVPVELAVLYGSQITFHQIDALHADTAVPPIVVAAPTQLTDLTISLPPARDFGGGKFAQYTEVLFFRVDGQMIYKLKSGKSVNRHLPARKLYGSFDIGIDNERPSVPPGTYLVVPKPLLFDQYDIAILYALRAGHDFSNSGIPIVTIAASPTPQVVDIDFHTASDALITSIAPLLTARLPHLGPDPKPYVAPPVTPPASPSPPAPPTAPPGGGG